jgi:hypothetical protein
MRDIGCPPFLEVLFNLFCIVLSFAMIGYILIWLSTTRPEIVPPEVYMVLLAFGAIIVYCSVRLGKGLFPARCGGSRVSLLVKEIIEIEGTVR